MLFFGNNKYNDGTHKKNTDLFKTKIGDLSVKFRRLPGSVSSDMGTILSRIAKVLDQTKFKGKDYAENLKAIDERILHILDLMDDDIDDENLPALSCHADLLFESINKSRKKGVDEYKKDYYEQAELRAQALGKMRHAIDEKEIILNKIDELKAAAQAANARGDQAELQRINLDFQAAKNKLKLCENRMADWERQHNAAVRILNEYDQEQTLDELDASKLMNQEDLAKMVNKNTARLENHVNKTLGIIDITNEAEDERAKMRDNGTKVGESVITAINDDNANELLGGSQGHHGSINNAAIDPELLGGNI